MTDIRRLRIPFITVWYPTPEQPIGGTFVQEHARAAQAHDDVVVLHLAGARRDLTKLWHIEQEGDTELSRGLPTYRVWCHRPTIPKLWYLLFLWSAYRAYRHILDSGFQPDVIHAHEYEAGLTDSVTANWSRRRSTPTGICWLGLPMSRHWRAGK